MKKYFLTGDLEYTSGIGSSLQIESIRDDCGYTITQAMKGNIKTEVMHYQDIVDYFASKRSEDECIVSLDGGVYSRGVDAFFDATRVYDSLDAVEKNPTGYTILQRDGSDLALQIRRIVSEIKQSKKDKITVVDDGLFSGDTIKSVIESLSSAGLNVDTIRVLLNFTGKKDLGGIPIESMVNLPISSVVDWIDERDFYYGVTMGGASFLNSNGDVNGLPYISSANLVAKKASLPRDAADEFCKNMIDLNKRLYSLLEQEKGTSLVLSDYPRIGYLAQTYSLRKRMLDLLDSEKNSFI